MAVFQISASFRAYGLWEHYWSASDPRPYYREYLWTWPWGMSFGVSCPPPWCLEAPPIPVDPVVVALNAKLVKTWGGGMKAVQLGASRPGDVFAPGLDWSEPRDPPNPRGVALHGFGLGVKRHIPTGEEMQEIERRMLERHGMGNK